MQGLTEIEIRNMDNVMMVMNEGEKNRTVASTKMNTNRYTRHMYTYIIVQWHCDLEMNEVVINFH